MKITKPQKSKSRSARYVVKKPATLKDYVRIYGMKNGLLKEAQLLAKKLRPAH